MSESRTDCPFCKRPNGSFHDESCTRSRATISKLPVSRPRVIVLGPVRLKDGSVMGRDTLVRWGQGYAIVNWARV